MDEMLAFLRACVDDDEAAAKAVTFRSRFTAIGNSVQSPGGVGNPPMPIADVIDAETAAHIALHDPARELREVAFKRAILDGYETAAKSPYDLPAGVHDGRDDSERLRDEATLDIMDTVIRALITVYSDRPGYRESWAP